MDLYTPQYSTREEIVNSLTHGIGACLSIAGLVLLIVHAAQRGDAWRIVSFSIYGSTLVLMFLGSTLYHSFRNPTVKHILKIVDHSMIYLLIAGTYTPFMLVSLRGPLGWTLFGIIWILALTGISIKIVLIGKNRILSTFTYVLMGWLCVIALKQMIASIPPAGMHWLIAGGLFYTFGVVFYIWRKLPFNHAIWHLFVLCGSICHYFSILYYIR
jgi:hemolysin III